jgi:hypothetical protein
VDIAGKKIQDSGRILRMLGLRAVGYVVFQCLWDSSVYGDDWRCIIGGGSAWLVASLLCRRDILGAGGSWAKWDPWDVGKQGMRSGGTLNYGGLLFHGDLWRLFRTVGRALLFVHLFACWQDGQQWVRWWWGR